MNGAVRALPDHPVVMDVHFYHFSVPFDGWRTLRGHLRKVRRRQWLINWLVRKQPIIIGEWSGVISGRKMRRVPDSRQRVFESSYLRLQRDIQHVAEGQFYWNYKPSVREFGIIGRWLKREVSTHQISKVYSSHYECYFQTYKNISNPWPGYQHPRDD